VREYRICNITYSGFLFEIEGKMMQPPGGLNCTIGYSMGLLILRFAGRRNQACGWKWIYPFKSTRLPSIAWGFNLRLWKCRE
jgi:hypothetical protein